jgi:VIT1/CCC1 family predicted Fe2+/Mn2+ transporter
VLPLVAILGPWQPYRIVATVGAVVVSLVMTGYWAARAGKSKVLRSIVRNVVVSLLTMGIAYLIGAILGETLA